MNIKNMIDYFCYYGSILFGILVKPLPQGMLKNGGFSFFFPLPAAHNNLRISTVEFQADLCMQKQMDGYLKELGL